MSKKDIVKPRLKDVRNIVFDLGNVLLNLDFEASVNAFRELGMDEKVVNSQQAYADPVFYALEVGRTTPEAFRNRVREILDNPDASDQQIDDAWCAMLRDIPASRVEVVKQLNKKFRVYLFSNTNRIHIGRLHRQFKQEHGMDFPSLFVKDFYSHELHERKPDLSSYKKMIKLSGITPAETLFIDDLEKNIRGAQDAGLMTYWLKSGMELTDLF